MAKPEVTMMSRDDFAKIANNNYVNKTELDVLENTGLSVPVIKNLDACILAAIEAGGELDMTNWHDDGICGTTHCRGGWAIHLAGSAGYALEYALGIESAAACIYLASTGRVPDFFAMDEDALEDIRRCAAEQARTP